MSNVLAEDFAPPKPKAKKNLPPQPAMFRLHAPISVPTSQEGGDVATTGGNGGRVDQPDAKPSAKPSSDSKEGTTASMDKKSSNFDTSFLDSDSDDDGPKFPQTAIKRPRNTASAEAYAKRMREKEEAAKKKKEEEEEEKASEKTEEEVVQRRDKRDKVPVKKKNDDEDEGITTNNNNNKKVSSPEAEGKEAEKEEIEEDSSNKKKSSVKTKSTPKDAPLPRKTSTRNSKAGLKSPPEEIVGSIRSTRASRSRSSGRDGELKSPPEDMVKENSRRRSTRASKKSTPATNAASGRRSSRISSLEDSGRKSKRKHDEEVEEVPAKRSRKQSLEAQEADINQAAVSALKNSPPSKKSAAPKRTVAKKAKTTKVKNPAQYEYLEAKIDATYQERMALLRAHKKKYNTCDLTAARLAGETVDSRLRSFAMESRKQYKKYQRGERSRLTQAKIEEMEKVGFDFEPLKTGSVVANHNLRFAQLWDVQYEELKKYKAKHGDCLVSSVDKDAEVRKLGNWVRSQRKKMSKHGKKGFDKEQLKKLDALGFDWCPLKQGGTFMEKRREKMFPRIDANWQKRYTSLVEFKEKNGGSIIIGPSTKGYPGLYDWVHTQRKEYKKYEKGDEKALMYEEWVEKLNEIGFEFAPMKSGAFSKMLKDRQAQQYSGVWEKQFAKLKAFKKKTGHCYPARNSIEESTIASWIHVQRKQKVKHDKGEYSSLTEERIQLLDGIGLDWAPSKSGGLNNPNHPRRKINDKEWETTFKELVAFKKKHGHTQPGKSVKVLGGWVCRMRALYAKRARGDETTLTDDKIAKLESIGFQFAQRSAQV